MLNLDYDITNLRGADYNPRQINEADIKILADSIDRLGMVKPLIVRGDLLVAGHQRTKALLHLGVKTAPVYVLSSDTTVYDEVRFNQLHNGTDMDSGDEQVKIRFESGCLGFVVVEPAQITGNFKASMANVRSEICSLITCYGSWGSCVATQSGKVIHCAQYALSAAITRQKLTCYVIPDEREAEYSDFLGRKYGVFSYDHLPKETYIQSLAQIFRLREGPKGNKRNSAIYETLVLPWLNKNPGSRLIDFGSGQGDYVQMLRQRGIKISEIEFFRRPTGKHQIDLNAVHGMVDQLIGSLKEHGQFDAVVCDSVMNSVDSLEAEKSVLAMLNALCKVGCPVFFSGRVLESLDAINRQTVFTGKTKSGLRGVEFLDKDGFSGLYRKGRWFYQKFHSREQIKTMTESNGLSICKTLSTGGCYQIVTRKLHELPFEQVEQAINFEFNLPLPDGSGLGRHGDVLNAFKQMKGA